jgi:hypothetical protein
MSSSHAESQSRLILLLIAGTPVVIILAASWLWYFVIQGNLDLVGSIGTSNNGKLVTPPRQIEQVSFRDDTGVPFVWADLERRWTMVIVNRGQECDAACERRLYFTRQVHIALGKEFNRVQRIFINDRPIASSTVAVPESDLPGWPKQLQGDSLAEYLTIAHQGLVPLAVSSDVVLAQFPELEENAAQWFLIDPAGWIMMSFDDSLDYKAVMADLKFLLKHSGGA